MEPIRDVVFERDLHDNLRLTFKYPDRVPGFNYALVTIVEKDLKSEQRRRSIASCPAMSSMFFASTASICRRIALPSRSTCCTRTSTHPPSACGCGEFAISDDLVRDNRAAVSRIARLRGCRSSVSKDKWH